MNLKQSLMMIWALMPLALFSQKAEIHTPDQILKIMDSSKLAFNILTDSIEIPPTDRSKQVNITSVYRVVEKNALLTKKYDFSTCGDAWKKAEEFFAAEDYPQARAKYEEALHLNPKLFVAYTFIGQSYEAEKNYEKAESWYRRAIDSNYIDYMAHWFLADNLMLSGKKKEAMEQIIIAHILNRNNTKIQNSLETILQANNKKWIDWSFTPQYSLERKGDHDVNIKASLNWFGYALVKSVWKYEPGYKQSMGYDEDNPVIETEEREAILAELQMLQDKNDKELSLDLIAMKKALDKKAIQPYIFYEIFLLQYPSIAYQLPDELIQNIKTYILAVRVE